MRMTDVASFQSALSACIKTFSANDTDLATLAQSLSKGLAGDIKALEKERFIFSGSADIAQNTDDCVDFLRRWHVLGNPPTLAELCAAAALHLNIKNPDHVMGLMMASILGEVENTQPYHNNNHFRKVVLQIIRLIDVHNRIYGGTAKALGEEDMTLLLVAACIHDYGHDGLGNTVKGVFIPSRLELQSVKMAMPHLRAVGIDQEEILKALVVATEVSPLHDPASSVMQMKAAYRFHFLGDSKKFDRLNLSDDLKILEREPKICLMACLLHEADMATSAGLSYELTVYETVLVRDEIGTHDARPEHIVEFLDVICQRKFLSDAGQKLYAGNLARIYALAEEDVKAGNEPFPKAQHTDFILSFGQSKGGGAPKTLN